jgi:hypothetical protein
MAAMLRTRTIAITAATLVSVVLPLDAGAALPRKDAGYQGSSSEKAGPLTYPVALRVSKSGASVTRFDVQWSAKCTPAGGRRSLTGLAVIKNRPISPKGAFSSAASYSRDFADGQKALYTVKMAGSFTKRILARGTLRITVSITDAAGTQVDSCDSGAVTWQARD